MIFLSTDPRSPAFNAWTHLDITRQGEIFPEGMSLEAVVSEDAPQVGMVGEEDSVEIPNFPLVPVSPFEHLSKVKVITKIKYRSKESV